MRIPTSPSVRTTVRFPIFAAMALAAIPAVGARAQNLGVVPEEWKTGDVKWIGDQNPRNKIDDQIDAAGDDVRHDIVVNFRTPVEGAQISALSGKGDFQVVGSVMSFVCMGRVSGADVRAIAQRSDVAFIQKQARYYKLNGVAAQDTKVRARALEDGPLSPYSPDTVQETFPAISGQGVNIAVCDTGCDDPGGPGTTNTGLPAAVFSYDAIAGSFTNPDDKDGHGTHVAGTALGRGTKMNNVPVVPRGVASGPPANDDGGVQLGAGLIDVKVLGDDGGGTTASVMAGLQVLLQRRQQWNVGVVNMSLGGGPSSDGNDAESHLVDRMSAEGIIMVISAGNSGPSNAGLTAPGAASSAITVGNYDDRNTVNRSDNVINDSSSRGPRDDNDDGLCLNERKPEVSAPGTNIFSCKFDTQTDGQDLTGTSMAAPHVAGICALIRQANPGLTPSQVKDILVTTAERRGPGTGDSCSPDWRPDFGFGMVDAFAAVTAAANTTDLPPARECVTALVLQSPVGNETFVKNTTRRIIWSFEGNREDTVDILLISGTTYVGAVVKNAPVQANGFDWLVGSPLDNSAPVPPGSQYRIVIRPSFCATPSSMSPAFFTIIDSVIADAAPTNAVIPPGGTIKTVEIAPGESVTLGDIGQDGTIMTASSGQAPYTYRWTPGDFLSSSATPRPVASPPRTIVYTLEVRDSTGTTDTDQVQVKVGTPLRVDAGQNKTYRLGSTVLLEGSAVGGLPPYHYAWDPIPDPTQPAPGSGVGQPQPLARPAAPTVYTLTVTDDAGAVASDTVAVVPGVALTIINNPGNAGTVERVAKPLYSPGEELTIEAVPNAGWVFARWNNAGAEFADRPADSDAAFSNNPTRIVFGQSDLRIEAVFAQIIGTLPPTSGGGNVGGASGLCGTVSAGLVASIALGFGLMRRQLSARRPRR